MFSIFKRIPLYIKVYKNKIEMTNINTGETVSKNSLEPFSTGRFIISNFNIADNLIREIIKELGLKRRFLPHSFNILIQQMEKLEGGLSSIEKRAYRDLSEQAGAIEVHIVEHQIKLSAIEALLELNRKDNY